MKQIVPAVLAIVFLSCSNDKEVFDMRNEIDSLKRAQSQAEAEHAQKEESQKQEEREKTLRKEAEAATRDPKEWITFKDELKKSLLGGRYIELSLFNRNDVYVFAKVEFLITFKDKGGNELTTRKYVVDYVLPKVSKKVELNNLQIPDAADNYTVTLVRGIAHKYDPAEFVNGTPEWG